MKKIFQSLPSPVQKQVILRLGGGLLFMILFIIMLIMSRDFTMSLPALVVDIFLFINVGVILYTFLKGKYISERVSDWILQRYENEPRRSILL